MPLLATLLTPWTRRMVYPAGGTRTSPAPGMVELAVPGATLRGWEVNPGQPRALVYLGGNGESIQDRRGPFAVHFPGHTTYLISYRGYGASDGRPSQEALVDDVQRVHDFAAAQHPDHPVDVVGRSLGTGVAVQLAVRRRLGHLALVTPFDSVVGVATAIAPRWLARQVVADPWHSAAVAGRLDVPVLVLRAGQDATIVPARTDALISALPAGTPVIDYPGADHQTIIAEPSYWTDLAEFLG